MALSFYATGIYQRLVGGTQGTMMSQQSVSRALREVTNVFLLQICDEDLNIMSVDSSFGGASHDTFVWNQHPVKNHIANLVNAGERAFLLGKHFIQLFKLKMNLQWGCKKFCIFMVIITKSF